MAAEDGKRSAGSETVFEPLRSDVQLSENAAEAGEGAWLLFDPVTGKYYHVGEKEYTILSLFGEPSTAEGLLEKVNHLDESVTLADVHTVISFAFANNLLRPMPGATELRIKQMTAGKNKNRWSVLLQKCMFFKIPLLKPDKFLGDTLGQVKTVLNRRSFMALGLLSLWGYVLLISRWQEVEETLFASFTYSGLIKYSVAIVFIKAIHELAHAYTAKNFGIRVRSFGVGLIVFFPRFFTDITDSWKLPDRKKRVLIDAAGILSELLIGGLAAVFWAYSRPGVLQAISYYIFAVSILNTVLVNGNPFIRYDGYYILMDMVGIDNLQMKSRLLIQKLFRKKLFDLDTVIPFAMSGWKRQFAIAYGISSFIYRIFLYTGIILIVYYQFTKVVGVVLVASEIYVFFIVPIRREAGFIYKSLDRVGRKNATVTLSVAGFFLFIFLCPLPWTVSAPCVVGSAKDNVLYVQAPGILKSVQTKDSSGIRKGDTLFVMENPFLEYSARKLRANLEIREMELDQISSLSGDTMREPPRGKMQQVEQIRNDMRENGRKLAQMSVKSPFDGTFVLWDRNLKPGKWLEHGDAVGEIFSENDLLVYAYCEEENIDAFNTGREVKFYMHGEATWFYGEVVGVTRVPTREWRASPLLESSGGELPVLRRNDKGRFILTDYYYQITIMPKTREGKFMFSRTGTVQVRQYFSVGVSLLRSVISTLQKESAF